ncbi:hypothetical protein RM96_09465 [Cupriavidus sp. IDO]|nr:hypothetical protein RM96_09465 [Cupriavidus sp. IDO]
MNHTFIYDAIGTPIGRYGGSLSSVRTDDLGAVPIHALMARNPMRSVRTAAVGPSDEWIGSLKFRVGKR